MKSNRILLKATEFHRILWNQQDLTKFHNIQHNFTKSNRISWNQQDLTKFHKVQHNFTKSNRMYWNPEISKHFMRSNMILLKTTEFYSISLNSLQISLHILLQISIWMSFMDFTAYFNTYFTANFIMDFTSNFMPNLPYFIINFMTNFIMCTRISLKSTGFHYPVKSVMKFTMKSVNETSSKIHNEILLISVYLLNLMRSYEMLWISWNSVIFCGLHEIPLLLVKSCWILLI